MAVWELEPGHTAVTFAVRHMMLSWVRGRVGNVSGIVEFDPETRKLHALEATIDMKSLSTGHAERDGHLHSPDFFDVVSHPTATFQSVEIEQTGAQDYRVTGELTMRGVTKSVTLDLSSLGAWRVPHGKAVVPGIAFTGCATIDRHEFGVSWNDRLENSGVVVGNAVRLTLDIEAHPKN